MKTITPPSVSSGMLRLTEAYDCVEGEGKTAGAKTFLVRLSGCNLRCWWCDSKYSSFDESEAHEVSWMDIQKQVTARGAAWLSITGGEPTWRSAQELQSLVSLCLQAKATGLKVKIETNGLAFPENFLACVDLWSVSPKWDSRLSGKKEAAPGVWARTAAMDYDEQILAMMLETLPPTAIQLKLVICFDERGRPLSRDFEEAASLLKMLRADKLAMVPIFLIPQAYENGGQWDKEAYLLRFESLENAARALYTGVWKGLDLRVQTQHHRLLYGDQRGV